MNHWIGKYRDRILDSVSYWVGRWWICIWSTDLKEINIGLGDDLGEGYFGAFFIKNYRKGPFWISVSKPTMHFLNRRV